MGETGLLSDAAIDRTIAALKICAERIARHRVRHVRAIATQAARQAANTDLLIARARDEAGIALVGDLAGEEADLAALGCAPLIGRKYQGALIFDIGGGSTEIVWQHKGGGKSARRFAASLPVGVVNLAEDYGAAARNRAGFERMLTAMTGPVRRLSGADAGLRSGPRASAGHLGHGDDLGGARAQAAALQSRQGGCAAGMKPPACSRWWTASARLDVAALARIGAIGPERADLMLAGSAIFAAICALWPSPMLRVADRGLREGMLRQMREELSDAAEGSGMKTPSGSGAAQSASRSRRRAASKRRRANGWRASSTILMSMRPRRRAIAAAPPSSCWSWTPNSIS